MTINVYRSIMPGDPDEVYQEHGITVEEWVKSNTANYEPGKDQPISCMINGLIVKPDKWDSTLICERDKVDFRVVPHGDALNALAFVFPTVFGPIAGPGLAINALLDIPGQQGAGPQGGRINPADARANTARPGSGIPEGFGEYIRYPDYLNQPRTFYQDKDTQVLRLLLCVGVGEYEIQSDSVKIGQTPFNDLSQASFEIYSPGADLSLDPNHENWFQSPEVGATQGSAGIRLKAVTLGELSYVGPATASGDTLSGITGADEWAVGLTGAIKLTQDVTVVDGGGSADVFQGDFQHLLAGMSVNVESDRNVNGTYVVTTINGTSDEITLETTGGTPITDATVGAGTMAIDKAGTGYEILTITSDTEIEVKRILSGGADDPDWANLLPQGSLAIELQWESSGSLANYSGPFVACPQGEITDTIEWDIFLPQGQGFVDDQNVIPFNELREFEIQYREFGDVIWISGAVESISEATRDQLGFTFTLNLPYAMRPEIRVARLTPESTSIADLDRTDWTALRAKLPTVTSYEDITTMSVTIIGSDEIGSGSNNQVNLELLRKLPEISGGAFTAPVATRNISAAAAYVAKSLGYADSELDLDEFERLQTIWTARGDTFDYVFSDTTAKDAISTILQAGFSEATIETGIIKPVRDEARTVFEQGYSPENMTAPLTRSFNGKSPEEPDGVEVEYTKAGTWTKETIQAFLPGDLGIKLDKITLDGVTDETRAWRIGMRRRRSQRYRRWNYSFSTELDALNSEYLSHVPLLDDIPGYGKVSILLGIESDRITVSEPLEFVSGKTHVVAYRDENGDTIGPFTATQGPDEYTALVTIPAPQPLVNPSTQEPTHIYFGTIDRWHFPALITEISPSGPLQTSVSAVNYDDRVYLDDDNSPP